MILLTELHAQGRKAAVLSVDYSLAPEFPYPRSLKEILAAYAYVIERLHIPADRIVVSTCAAVPCRGSCAGKLTTTVRANSGGIRTQWASVPAVALPPACSRSCAT